MPADTLSLFDWTAPPAPKPASPSPELPAPEPVPCRAERRATKGRPIWRLRAPGRCAMLRLLLADGHWHSAEEMRHAGGWRYGARIYELRRGDDKQPPLVIEDRCEPGSGEWFYRLAPVAP